MRDPRFVCFENSETCRGESVSQNIPMPTQTTNGLIRGLGFYGATSVVAGTMIGTAIFLVPSDMLHDVGRPLLVLGVWAFSGVLSLFGALGYAELGAAMPEAGGEYVYLRRAYGPMMGFLYGWTQFLVAKTASIAAIATGFVAYLAYFLPRLYDAVWQSQLSFGGHTLPLRVTGLQVGATLMILLLSTFNIFGVRGSGAVQASFTASKLAVLVILILLGLSLGQGSFGHFGEGLKSDAHGSLISAWGAATVSALWAYDGWNNLSMVAGEIERPERNVPAALITGTLLVGAVYVLANVAYFYVLAPHDVLRTQTVAAETARRFLGNAGGAFIAIGVLISTFATLNGSILAGSRVPYAQARDGLFPLGLARLNSRFRTPVVSLLAQASIAGLFALSGQYRGLYTKAIFSEWVFYALVTSAVLILRLREPGLPRPYRAWGYPWVPATFIVLAFLFLVNTFFEQRSDLLWCLLLMGSGVPAYFLWQRWQRRPIM